MAGEDALDPVQNQDTPTDPVTILYGEQPDEDGKKPDEEPAKKDEKAAVEANVDEPVDEPGEKTAGEADSGLTGKDKGAEGEEPKEPTEIDKGAADEPAEVTSLEEFEFGDTDFQELTVNVTIDRETKPVPVSELVKGYQIGEAGEKRLAEANELKDKLRQEQSVQQKQYQESVQLLPQVAKLQGQDIYLDRLKADLDASNLRVDNPAEWTARARELDDAKARLRDEYGKLTSGAQEQREREQGEVQEQMKTYLQTEYQSLTDKRPDLADEKAFATWGESLVTYAVENGFTEDGIREIADHKVLLMLDKAKKYDQAGKTVQAEKKRAVAPKVLKPGPKTQPKQAPKDAAEILYG